MSAPALIGGFAEPEVNRILATACRRVGLDPEGAAVLRGHTNAVFRLRTAPVVAKIARSGTRSADVHRTVRLIEWLTSLDFPTVSLHPVEQPVLVDGHSVTFWTYLPQPEHPVTAEQIAGPLRTLHQLPHPPFEIRPLDTVGAIRRSIATITALPSEDLQYLSSHLDHLEKELADLHFALPPAVLQGDPQHRNALHDGDHAVLCDWDTTAFGSPEMDLVTIEIHCRRFGYGPAHYAAFANAYGFDVTTWDGYTVLRDLRELRMITTNAKRAAAASATLAEVTRRIEGLQHGDHQMRWNIL
ncbi:aminoglycoside phosphotransferase (APT) family kinase protein [Kitasatospora sp. MAP12-15]|uniref:phosphotransferase family protein n=1 Tax=unclassified Kitasatospora TaxID=2633591 RepID=UPI0024749B00|nr:aminoglycoside phosphotransferase family protein [Kitasatospora sp. MAP12-44]MDH6108349.1 aminoglycoside phosphotransferase (APT) family kinase protein [Kitasatospora sp. MAP12-44]